jgi:hypothetical protein
MNKHPIGWVDYDIPKLLLLFLERVLLPQRGYKISKDHDRDCEQPSKSRDSCCRAL